MNLQQQIKFHEKDANLNIKQLKDNHLIEIKKLKIEIENLKQEIDDINAEKQQVENQVSSVEKFINVS